MKRLKKFRNYPFFNYLVVTIGAFILASGYVRADALIGADVWTNFSPFGIGVQAHIYADAAAGLSAITGTSISGGFNVKGTVLFEFTEKPNSTDKEFIAQGTLDLGFSATISQSLVFTTISKSIDVNCHASGGTDGFDFSFGSGDPKVGCVK